MRTYINYAKYSIPIPDYFTKTDINKIDAIPNELLLKIFLMAFEKVSSSPPWLEKRLANKNITSLSLVSKRFHEISEDNTIWSKLAELHGYNEDFHKHQTPSLGFNNKELFYLTFLAKKIDKLKSKGSHSQATIQIKFIKALPKKIPLFDTLRLQALSQAKVYIDDIFDSYCRTKSDIKPEIYFHQATDQIKLVKLNYHEKEIAKAKKFIDKIKEPSLRDAARITLLRVFIKFQDKKNAEDLLSQMTNLDQLANPSLIFEVYLNFIKIDPKFTEIINHHFQPEMNKAKYLWEQTPCKTEENKKFENVFTNPAQKFLKQQANPDTSILKEIKDIFSEIRKNPIKRDYGQRHLDWPKTKKKLKKLWIKIGLNINKLQDLSLIIQALDLFEKETHFYSSNTLKHYSPDFDDGEKLYLLIRAYNVTNAIKNLFERHTPKQTEISDICVDNPEFSLYSLPDATLLKIFCYAISSLQDASTLALTCKKFNTFTKEDLLWQTLSNKLKYKQLTDLTWKQSYFFEKKILKLFCKILSSDESLLNASLGFLELYKNKFSLKEAISCTGEIGNLEIEPMKFIKLNLGETHSKETQEMLEMLTPTKIHKCYRSRSQYLYASTQIKYLKATPITEEKIQSLKKTINKITGFKKILAQIEYIKAIKPSLEEIKYTEELIKDSERGYSCNDRYMIKHVIPNLLMEVYLKFNMTDKTEDLKKQMSKLSDEDTWFFLLKNNPQKVIERGDGYKMFSVIVQKPFCNIIKAYLQLGEIKKAEDLIEGTEKSLWRNKARIWLLKYLIRNIKNV